MTQEAKAKGGDVSDPAGPLAFAIERVCEVTSLGRTSVFAAIKNGELIARKRGRRTIVLASDLQAFLQRLPLSKGRL